MLRFFLAGFLPTSALLGAILLLLYSQDRAAARLVHSHDGEHLVHLQSEIIAGEFAAIESDLLFLAEQNALREFLARGTAETRAVLAEEFRLFCARKGLYDQVRFLDETGMERVRVNDEGGHPAIVPEEHLQSKAARYYFDKALGLDRGRVYVSPFDLNQELGRIEQPLKPVIRFATPLFDAGGRRRGILVLNYLGARLIAKVRELSAHFPGSVMLLNRSGYWLYGPRPEDEWGFMFGKDRTFEKDYPVAWRAIAAADRGQLWDDAGIFTFETSPGASQAGPIVTEDAITIVSFVPAAVVGERSDELLRRLLVLYGIMLVLLVALAGFLARARVNRMRDQERLRESELRLRSLSRQLLTAQEVERKSLSRNLHDDLGQLVTAICLDLERASQQADPAKREDLIRRALQGTRSVLGRVQEISALLRPSILDDLGLKDAVRSLLTEFEERTGIATEAELDCQTGEAPAEVRETLYRVLQEALTNVARHARADQVQVSLQVGTDRASLSVKDAGVGFRPESVSADSLGLLGMRERVELLGGEFALRSEPGHGTEVRVSMPVQGKADDGRA